MQGIVNRMLGLGCGLGLLIAATGCSSHPTDWTFTDSQGSERNLSDYKGQVVVIGFSNTWCEPCQEAAMHMQSLQERFGPAGVKVINVSSWERGDPEKWMGEHGYTYGVMLNGTDVARDYKIDRVPTFVVLGVDGRVIYRAEGFKDSTGEKIDRVVERHLAKHGQGAYAAHGG